MRKHDPKHSLQAVELQQLEPTEFKRRAAIQSFKDAEYVASEVLATLVRQRFGSTTGQCDAAAAELHRRIVKVTGIRIRRHNTWRKLLERNSELIDDTVMYVWDKLLSDAVGHSNAEVRFEVFLGDRVVDYMRNQMAAKNSIQSIDDEDGDEEDARRRATDLIEDPNGESPEEAVMRSRKSKELTTLLLSLPKAERNAFYYRIECEYEWAMVAKLMNCSVPTARLHLERSWEKLQGANE